MSPSICRDAAGRFVTNHSEPSVSLSVEGGVPASLTDGTVGTLNYDWENPYGDYGQTLWEDGGVEGALIFQPEDPDVPARLVWMHELVPPEGARPHDITRLATNAIYVHQAIENGDIPDAEADHHALAAAKAFSELLISDRLRPDSVSLHTQLTDLLEHNAPAQHVSDVAIDLISDIDNARKWDACEP